MNILFDQETPAPLRHFLLEATVVTAAERGWSDLSNGELITAAEHAGFDALITTDRNLEYQQNLSTRRIAIIVVLQPAWPILKNRAAEVAANIATVKVGDYLEKSAKKCSQSQIGP